MSTLASHESDPRERRINIRVSAANLELIRQAAQMSDQTVTDFVLTNSAVAAERVLADRRAFALSADSWADLDRQLNRNVTYKPRLRERLAVASPFVDQSHF